MDFTEIIFDCLDDIKFHNIAYRNYLGIWRGYVIRVTTFDLNVYNLYDTNVENYENEITTSKYFGYLGTNIYSVHQNTYLNGSCRKDPCDIFEIVSGDRIHNGGSDRHKIHITKEYYADVKKLFISEMRKQQRNKKIDNVIQ